MIEIVWEMIVQEDKRSQFELIFGPGGTWSKLFGKSQGYRGTTVLNDTHNPVRYLIVDIWDTDEQQAQARRDGADEYAKLTADLDNWTESRTEVGIFRVRAEATVRPDPKSSRRKRR